jgi:hypothetical protein
MATPRSIHCQKLPSSRLSLAGAWFLPPRKNDHARCQDPPPSLPPGQERPPDPSCLPPHSLDLPRATVHPHTQRRVVLRSQSQTHLLVRYLLCSNCPLPYSKKRRTQWCNVRSAKGGLACGPSPHRNKTTPFKFRQNLRPQNFLQTVNLQCGQGESSLNANSICSKSTALTVPMLLNPLLYPPSHRLHQHQPTDIGDLRPPFPTSTSAWARRGRSKDGGRFWR